MKLNQDQKQRYERQLILKEIGLEGQNKLLKSKVLVIGAGGLGSPVILYLAAMGVGNIGVIDDDYLEISNLQRQIIYDETDLKLKKVDAVKKKIDRLNQDVNLIPHFERLNNQNCNNLFLDYDFILDATDNFDTKFLICDTAVKMNKPFSHAGIDGFEGQTMTVIPGKTACYRCVFNKKPASITKNKIPIFPPVAGIIGSIQASQAIKFLLKKGNLLTNKILTYNALNEQSRTIQVKKQKKCPSCSL